TERERNARLHTPYADRAVAVAGYAGALPFEPVAIDAIDLPNWVGQCEIDHAVAPVPGMSGGSSTGYARWEAWKAHGLNQYHRRRNDAVDREGVSRLSPWLHHGMVSPLRIAREAAALGGGGPEKFLDELLIWRELAHVYCFHRADHLHSVDVLPAWARETLAAHEGDPRPLLPSWETLARGRTGDALWDAAQRSLLAHGELHNNLRMTWGKALVGWTPDAPTALDRLIDLNHRYALDGRDPNSYGGLLWCLGAFDSAKAEEPILGQIRSRPTETHAERLDLESYIARVHEPAAGPALRIAVIGAGLSGLAAARTLADHNHTVTVFDKARGPAGRTSHRRADPFAFDHGAQYFTARDPRFVRWVDAWRHDGLVAPWEGRIAVLSPDGAEPKTDNPERFVGVPGMNAVAKHLAAGLDLRVRTRIVPLVAPRAGEWILTDEEGREYGPYDRVLVTLPAGQAADLVGEVSALGARAAAVEMRPCIAAMLAFETPLEVDFDGAFVHDSPLAWVARDSSKPGRPSGDQWVLHSGAEWARAHWDEDRAGQQAALGAEFARLVGPLPALAHGDAHRWLYSIAPEPLEAEYLADDALGLVLCGDWCRGGRVEGAVLSGIAAAGHLLRRAAAEVRRDAVSARSRSC
ncbi:MAG: FAD-dependent oxidoreductase, partial [Planctomycetota bacterium]